MGVAKAIAPEKPLLTAEEKRRIAELVLQAAQEIAAAEDDAADAHTLAGILYQSWVSTYEQSLAAEAKNAGFSSGVVKLTDPDVLGTIRLHAEETSTKIFQTFEKDLLRFVHALPADTDPADVPRLIAEWNLQRDMWKVAQIAITETAKAAGQAQKDFIARSGAKGKAWFGNSLQCPICQRVAANNPYDLSDPTVGDVPHPHCLDYWDIEYDSIDEPWKGD